jgi:hypothetical protein
MIGTAMRKKPEPDTAGRLMRAVRKAETSEFDRKRATIKDPVVDVGTGQTILKMRKRPIPSLIDDGKLDSECLDAAQEIETAYSALTTGLFRRGINYDRVDNGRGGSADWPYRVALLVKRYQEFARAWTQRNAEYGDPMLELLIDAIYEDVSIHALRFRYRCRHEKIERAIICGLRDYAARAGLVSSHKALIWQAEAALIFGPVLPELRRAARRAAVEA